MIPSSLALAAALAASAPTPAAAAAPDPAAVSAALEAAKPAASGWPLRNVRLDLGYGRLDVKDASLVPVGGSGSRPVEFVVLGDMKFHLRTTDPVEAYQIDLFTGSSVLDETVDQAVLLVSSPDFSDALTSRPGRAPLAPAVAKEASEVFTAWRAAPAWHRIHGTTDLFETSADDPIAAGRFAAWCRSPRLGTFLYSLDPFRPEQVKVEHYVDPRLGDQEAWSLRHELKRQREEGKYLEMSLQDFGDWDVWFSASLQDAQGAPSPGHEAFEPEHYDLHVEVEQDLQRVEGSAKISLRVRTPAERVLHLEINPDLVVRAVTDGRGRALAFASDDGRVAVVLPRPSAAGDEDTLEVRYGGVLFDQGQYGPRYKRDTEDWYPHAGTTDRATYHAVLDVPDAMKVLASGTEDGETVKDGRRVQTRTLAFPSANFGFEIGDYTIETATVGHIQVEIGYLGDVSMDERADKKATMQVVSDALTAYEAGFGPYPLDTLTIATNWQGFAQGFLGFVTLAQPVAHLAGAAGPDGDRARQVIAHELAHQWWGNLVGWDSYRDQWLSEALANYSAVLWRRHLAHADPKARIASGINDMFPWQYDLHEETQAGRPIEAIGPVTLGRRLHSSVADAYAPVVYQKGAMVFAMIAERVGEGPFVAMLKAIAQQAKGRPVDTRTFLGAIEKMSGIDLSSYMREFVYGVGYPEIDYRYTIAPAGDGSWTVSGEADQIPRGFRRDRLVAIEGGGVGIVPTFHAYQPVDGAQVLAPAIVIVGEGSDGEKSGKSSHGWHPGPDRIRGYPARLAVSGPESSFTLTVHQKPEELRIDPKKSLPLVAYDGTLEEKWTTVRRAEALRSSGREADAVAAFRKALTLPYRSRPHTYAEFGKHEDEVQGRNLDEQIHVALAEMALDDGRAADAKTELAAVPRSDHSYRLKVVRARLALRGGDAKEAYGILSDLLALYIRQTENDTAGDAVRAAKFKNGIWGDGGDYLLLAAAAERTGHDVVAREAAAEAVRRGAVPMTAPSGDATPRP